MKILLVVHYFLPHVGGMEAVVEKQAKSLVRRGHEVAILTCRPQKDLPKYEMRDGYATIRLPAFNFVEKKFGVTFPIISPFAFFWLLRHIAKYDIVHIHDVFYMSSHIAALSCLLQRKNFFLTQHVAMVEYPSKLVMLVQKIMYMTFGRLLFFQATKIICYNQIVKEFLYRQGVPKQKVFMQYNGIDTSYFSPATTKEKDQLRKKYGLPPNRPIALFAGRFVPKKGYDIVYKSQSSDHFTLLVGGNKPLATIKANENVKLFGTASARQLRDLYRASDAFVFPAIGEIFTLVMQEAMASGLPIITTDDPGYKQYTFSRKYIQLVNRDSEQIKQTLQKIFHDPERREGMSIYSRTFALENFDWERNYENEYALYYSLNTEKVSVPNG